MVSSISALLLLYQTQQLVTVGEAGHHVQLLAPVRLQRLDGLGHGIAADDLLPGDLRIVEAHGQVVDVLPAENDLFDILDFSGVDFIYMGAGTEKRQKGVLLAAPNYAPAIFSPGISV